MSWCPVISKPSPRTRPREPTSRCVRAKVHRRKSPSAAYHFQRSATRWKMAIVNLEPLNPALRPAINAPGRASLGHNNFNQLRQLRLEPPPDPSRDVFACGVFQSGDFVEVMMVKFLPERLEGGGNVRVIHQPAELRVAFARNNDFRLEAVPVETAA